MSSTKVRSILSGAVAAGVLLGCTWNRFDGVTENPPVERFDAPNDAVGTGQSVATFRSSGGVILAVSAQNHVLLYRLGNGVEPSRSAFTSQPCDGDQSCVLSQSLAGLQASALTENVGCVAYGVGRLETGTDTASARVLLLCEDLVQRSLAVPSAFDAWLQGRSVGPSTMVSMATTRRGSPQPLAVSVPDAGMSWFYDGLDPNPIELPPVPDGNAAARSLAVMREGSGYRVVAGLVTPDQTIWTYRVNADRAASSAGCVQGPAQFGRVLATGTFDDDAFEDLAVADAQHVFVLGGASLAGLEAPSSGVCTSLEGLAQLRRAECQQLPDLDGCAGSPYPMALAAGNLDATGPDELIVGAPNTSVRGEGTAGAAFVYASNSDALRIVQGLYVSTAVSGNWLGKSVAIAELGGIDTVLAGAPGDNAIMAFYCNSLMPAASKSARCH